MQFGCLNLSHLYFRNTCATHSLFYQVDVSPHFTAQNIFLTGHENGTTKLRLGFFLFYHKKLKGRLSSMKYQTVENSEY
jgi:hypothetical protein